MFFQQWLLFFVLIYVPCSAKVNRLQNFRRFHKNNYLHRIRSFRTDHRENEIVHVSAIQAVRPAISASLRRTLKKRIGSKMKTIEKRLYDEQLKQNQWIIFSMTQQHVHEAKAFHEKYCRPFFDRWFEKNENFLKTQGPVNHYF